jgi:hypothetical protein
MSLGKPKPAQKPAQPDPANTWRPASPGFEVNGLGHMRTANHRPGNVPTKPKLPVVIESDGGDCS